MKQGIAMKPLGLIKIMVSYAASVKSSWITWLRYMAANVTHTVLVEEKSAWVRGKKTEIRALS
jgi:hypothetical protein